MRDKPMRHKPVRDESGRPARMGRRSGAAAIARRIGLLAAVVPLLLLTEAAYPINLTNNVGPRLPTTIGPRAPSVTTVGPRFDPSYHATPGNGGASTQGGNNAGGNNGGGSNTGATRNTRQTRRSNDAGVPPAGERRYVRDHLVVEVVAGASDQRLTALFDRLHLARIEARRIALINTTFYLLRIADGGSVTVKIRALNVAGSGLVRTAQPNYLFDLVQAAASASATPETPDVAQYALAKLHLDEAHALARGDNVRVAIIDSGIDLNHPALAGSIEKTFDALNSSEGPHSHGTGIAGIIVGHGRLSGAAPAVRILAARAFSTTQGSTISIIASLDWAVGEQAQVVNMSFAGPSDPALERALAAAQQRGVVLVAATGNAGPKSPPLWPAADPHVIGVTATDIDDHLYANANRGRQVAIAAPGVDIMVANPGNTYKMETGTSFSAAFVSGVAALILQRNPHLTPQQVEKVLLATARDLGPKGRDELFGAGLMDAFQAVNSVTKATDAALQLPSH